MGGRPEASDGPEGHLFRGSPSGCRRGRLIAGSTADTPKAWFIGRGLGSAGGSGRIAVLIGTGTARTRLGSGLLLERLAGLLEVGELDLILNLEVGGEHASGSRDLRIKGVLETNDGVVALLGMRPLESKLVGAALDVVEKVFDILLDVEERSDSLTVGGDVVNEHADLGFHSFEPATHTLEAREFGDLLGRKSALELVGMHEEGLTPVLGEAFDGTVRVRLTEGTGGAARRRVCDRVPAGLSRGRLPVGDSDGRSRRLGWSLWDLRRSTSGEPGGGVLGGIGGRRRRRDSEKLLPEPLVSGQAGRELGGDVSGLRGGSGRSWRVHSC